MLSACRIFETGFIDASTSSEASVMRARHLSLTLSLDKERAPDVLRGTGFQPVVLLRPAGKAVPRSQTDS